MALVLHGRQTVLRMRRLAWRAAASAHQQPLLRRGYICHLAAPAARLLGASTCCRITVICTRLVCHLLQPQWRWRGKHVAARRGEASFGVGEWALWCISFAVTSRRCAARRTGDQEPGLVRFRRICYVAVTVTCQRPVVGYWWRLVAYLSVDAASTRRRPGLCSTSHQRRPLSWAEKWAARDLLPCVAFIYIAGPRALNRRRRWRRFCLPAMLSWRRRWRGGVADIFPVYLSLSVKSNSGLSMNISRFFGVHL